MTRPVRCHGSLSRLFPDAQIPLACLATTVELGGQADTGRAESEAHAEGILAFLAEQGLIGGEWPKPAQDACEGMPFEGTELLFAPHPRCGEFPAQAR